MTYAAGGQTANIVFEVQQGMVNRGDELSQPSQCPHEQKILLASLTGLEIMRTRMDGSVVTMEVGLSISLTTLEALSASFGQLQALEVLCVHECLSIPTLPDSFGQCNAQQNLELSGCSALEALPASWRAASSSCLYNCHALEALP